MPMSMSFVRRVGVAAGALALAGAGLVAVAGPASAHATLQFYGATPTVGGFGATWLRIPHGCSGQPTDTVVVEVPAGFGTVRPQALAGWTAAKVVNADGTTQLTWSGGSLPDGQFTDFGISLKWPDKAGTYYFPTVQKCGTAEVAWIAIPVAGQAEPAEPAPSVNVIAAPTPTPSPVVTPTAPVLTADLAVARAKHTATITVDALIRHGNSKVRVFGPRGYVATLQLNAWGDATRTLGSALAGKIAAGDQVRLLTASGQIIGRTVVTAASR